jgi:hypothetical protein
MDSFWAKTYGCQAEDCYELLRALLQDRKEILGAEAARYLGFDLEVIQPLLQRLVEEGVAVATGQGATCFYRWHEASRAGK